MNVAGAVRVAAGTDVHDAVASSFVVVDDDEYNAVCSARAAFAGHDDVGVACYCAGWRLCCRVCVCDWC